jgi:putative glutamine amidotransferase
VSKPRVGITSALSRGGKKLRLRRSYVQAVEAAGAIPLILPVVNVAGADELLTVVDGLLLTGGGDVHPEEYNQQTSSRLLGVHRDRDRAELALTRAALSSSLPILAICRGVQILNIAAGGNLHQDIGAEVPVALDHTQTGPRHRICHRVRLEPGSRLAEIFSPARDIEVNSLHHQALDAVADGLNVVGRAEDGIIEAVEAEGPAWVVGVQWHPESFAGFDDRFHALFAEFAKVCCRERMAYRRQGAGG